MDAEEGLRDSSSSDVPLPLHFRLRLFQLNAMRSSSNQFAGNNLPSCYSNAVKTIVEDDESPDRARRG